jgi:hypothetical protein
VKGRGRIVGASAASAGEVMVALLVIRGGWLYDLALVFGTGA